MTREAPYLDVADQLRGRILAGEWPAGAKLPSRARLAADYGVGRNVTQRAVKRLIDEGLLEGRAGSGTYVCTPPVRGRLVRSVGRDVSAAMLAGTDLIDVGRPTIASAHSKPGLLPPPAVAARLGIPENEPCVRSEYEFLTDRRVTQIATSWEPQALTDGSPVMLPEMGPLKGTGVVERMQVVGITVQSAREIPRPGRATPLEAARLGLNPGDLVLHIERTFYDTGGRAVETADFTVPDVRYEIVYEIGPPVS
jgi:GntR family transcriptional regulator